MCICHRRSIKNSISISISILIKDLDCSISIRSIKIM